MCSPRKYLTLPNKRYMLLGPMARISGGFPSLCLILLFPVLSLALYPVIHLQQYVSAQYRAAETATSKHLSLVSKTSYGPFSLFVLHWSFQFLDLFKPAMFHYHWVVFLHSQLSCGLWALSGPRCGIIIPCVLFGHHFHYSV